VSPHSQIPVIAIIGGIGSGKSAVANWVLNIRSTTVINADEIGHQVLEFPEMKQQIRAEFGDSVFDENGVVDRSELGNLVFGNSEKSQGRKNKLETIVHPVIRKEIISQIELAGNSGQYEFILLDAAVLLESGWHEICDAVVFVDVPEEVRLQRVQQTRGWSKQKFQDRENSQLSLVDKRNAANVIIDNSGSLEEAGEQLLKALPDICKSSS